MKATTLLKHENSSGVVWQVALAYKFCGNGYVFHMRNVNEILTQNIANDECLALLPRIEIGTNVPAGAIAHVVQSCSACQSKAKDHQKNTDFKLLCHHSEKWRERKELRFGLCSCLLFIPA